MVVQLELTTQETTALLLLLKLGMDCYTGADEGTAEVLEGMQGIANSTFDRVIAKVSRAGGKAAKGEA